MRKTEIERRLEKLFSDPVASPPLPKPIAPAREAPSPVAHAAHHAPDLAIGLADLALALGGSPTLRRATEQVAPGAAAGAAALKSILDQIPEAVFIKDGQHRWVVVNSAFCELVGRAEADLLGRSERDLFPADRADAAWQLDDQIFKTGQPNQTEEMIVSTNGRSRARRIYRRPLRDASGQTDYALGVIEDVSELKQIESALKESETKYRTASEWWEEKLRRLKRGLLFQFSFFGVVAGLSISVLVSARTPAQAATVATVTHTPTPLAAEIAASPTPLEATATATFTPLPSPTPTVPQPLTTIAPTIAPQAIVLSDTVIAPPAPAALREFGPNVINIVLMGSDRRPGDGAWRTDVLILVSVDPDVPSVTMLSFPRDLWVYIPGWRWQRINLADGRGESSGFPGGGPALVKQTIQYNFGVPVHYYARVDFSGYKNLIDSVGGVDVVADCTLYDIFPDVPDGENDIISGPALSTVLTGTIDIPVAGVYHLDGKHALWYSRSRKTTSDFDRSRRQQRVLRALWDEILAQGLLAQVPQLWDSFTRSVKTDMSLNDVLYLADVGSRLDIAHIRSRFIDSSMLTWHVTETGANVLLYDYDEISPYLDDAFAPLPKNIAMQAPAWVDVLNGTAHADWERVAADRLGWAGYSVPSWGKADTIYPHTTLVDYTLTAKGSRLEALAELFEVAPENIVRQPDPDSPVAYRIVVGEDWEPCQRPSRGRWPAAPAPTPTATPAP